MERKKVFEEVIHVLNNATRYAKKYESIPRNYGTDEILYTEECHAIDMIAKNEMISITQMAKTMGKTKSAVSQLMDRLVKKEMLEKLPHPDNDRGLILKLTEKGRRVFECHAAFDEYYYGKLFENLSDFSTRELSTYIEIQKEINRWIMKDNT